MSVLVKGMKMPESCQKCYLFNFKNRRISEFDHDTQYMKAWSCYNVCVFSEDRMVNDIRERPEWCPLIEIPPHGRLIDADKLIRNFQAMADNEWNKNCGATWSDGFLEAINMTEDAPTIIEATESE